MQAVYVASVNSQDLPNLKSGAKKKNLKSINTFGTSAKTSFAEKTPKSVLAAAPRSPQRSVPSETRNAHPRELGARVAAPAGATLADGSTPQHAGLFSRWQHAL